MKRRRSILRKYAAIAVLAVSATVFLPETVFAKGVVIGYAVGIPGSNVSNEQLDRLTHVMVSDLYPDANGYLYSANLSSTGLPVIWNTNQIIKTSIQIKAIERPQLSVTGGGIKKFYASPVHGKEITLEGLTKAIEKTSTVNSADIRAVLYALVEESVAGLSESRIIRLGDLGSLRITVSSHSRDKASEVTASAVKKVGVIFTQGKKLQEMLKSAKVTKA